MNSKLNKYLISTKKFFEEICIDNNTEENEFLDNLASLLNNGADIIELNGTNISTKKFLNLAQKARELSAIFNALLFIFDRVDIARLIDADGVITNKNSMPITSIIKLTEKNMLIGYKISDKTDFQTIEKEAVDFIVSPENYKNSKIKIFIQKK